MMATTASLINEPAGTIGEAEASTRSPPRVPINVVFGQVLHLPVSPTYALLKSEGNGESRKGRRNPSFSNEVAKWPPWDCFGDSYTHTPHI
jgi:hypothetical protein